MNEPRWLHESLQELVSGMKYPDTPDLSNWPVRRQPKLLAYSIAVVALVVGLGAAIAPVRSAVSDWVKAGAVTLSRWLSEPSLERAPPADTFLNRLARRVSIAEAQAQMPFRLALPKDEAVPDEFWLLDHPRNPTAIAIWRDSNGAPRLVLYQITQGQLIWKGVSEWEETQVGTHRAIWTSGPHLMRIKDSWETWALIEDNVLVWWTDQGVTYRLETLADRDDAIAIAESLQVLQ